MSNARAILTEAGLERLPEGMQEVFNNLSDDELAVVGQIQERLNAAAPDVEGQNTSNNCLC